RCSWGRLDAGVGVGVAIAIAIAAGACGNRSSTPVARGPVITIAIVQGGALAAELEHGAIAPIEQEIARLAGVRSLRSTIEPGRALVVISLDASRPIELAAAEVRRAIQELRPRLPEDLELPVISLAD